MALLRLRQRTFKLGWAGCNWAHFTHRTYNWEYFIHRIALWSNHANLPSPGFPWLQLHGRLRRFTRTEAECLYLAILWALHSCDLLFCASEPAFRPRYEERRTLGPRTRALVPLIFPLSHGNSEFYLYLGTDQSVGCVRFQRSPLLARSRFHSRRSAVSRRPMRFTLNNEFMKTVISSRPRNNEGRLPPSKTHLC